MALKNSQDQYGSVTKTFHWTIATLVLLLLPVGFFMGDLPVGTLKISVYNLHKSFGVTVLLLILLRFSWHIYNHRPVPLATLTFWEKHLSRLMHAAFYALLVAMPLSGWIMSSAAGRTVQFFGLFPLPDIVMPDQQKAKTFRELHEVIGTALMIMAGLHIAAALKHHFIDKDNVLRRMLPALFLTALLLPAGGASADASMKWNVLFDKSSITFRPKQMGAEFKGIFDLYRADIFFDPAHLAESNVAVDIDTAKASTGAADRDEALRGKEWFDVIKFPSARFESTAFRKTGEKTFEAEGTLRIRDVSLPVVLPFTLDIATDGEGRKTAVMDATIVIDRSKFGLGTGEWADVSLVANEVPVDIHLVAVPAN